VTLEFTLMDLIKNPIFGQVSFFTPTLKLQFPLQINTQYDDLKFETPVSGIADYESIYQDLQKIQAQKPTSIDDLLEIIQQHEEYGFSDYWKKMGPATKTVLLEFIKKMDMIDKNFI